MSNDIIITKKRKSNIDKNKKMSKLLNKVRKIKLNIIKMKSHNKANSKYYTSFEQFYKDFKDIIDSDVCNLHIINNLCTCLTHSYFFSYIIEKIVDEKMKNWKEENKLFLEELKNNNDSDDYYERQYDVEEKFRIDTNIHISEIILELLKLIYHKFKKLSDIIIYEFFTIYYKYNVDNIIKYLEEINFKTKNQKLINILYNQIDNDIYNIILNPNLSNIFNSAYMFNIDFKNISEFIVKHNLENNKEEIFDILIDIIITQDFLVSDNIYMKYLNILRFLLDNKKSMTTYQKIKLHGFSSIVIFCDKYYDIGHFDNNDALLEFFRTIIIDIKKLICDIEIKEKVDIDMIFKVDDIINTKLLILLYIYNLNCVVDDDTYSICHNNIKGIEIKKFIKEFRLIFINNMMKYIKKDKNIEKFYQLNIFKYDNFILSYDEKIALFNKSYSGRITNKDIEMFISHHNQIANHIMNNNVPTENMAKIAFNCGNINFIEYLINKKYIITTKHLTYILFYDRELLKNILDMINVYNLINYFDNFDWYYHLSYLYPDVDFSELLFNENNIEYREKLKEKIIELDKNNIVKKINHMSYIDFVKYLRFTSDKIKLDMKDIIKIDDYKKRWFLTNN